jgi:hypothetical protein
VDNLSFCAQKKVAHAVTPINEKEQTNFYRLKSKKERQNMEKSLNKFFNKCFSINNNNFDILHRTNLKLM